MDSNQAGKKVNERFIFSLKNEALLLFFLKADVDKLEALFWRNRLARKGKAVGNHLIGSISCFC